MEMTSKAEQDSWLIRRDVHDLTIVVSANYIPRLETFGITCKVNGTPYDNTQSDDPVQTALAMIAAVIAETIDKVVEVAQPALQAVA
jgi:hypothetical protein